MKQAAERVAAARAAEWAARAAERVADDADAADAAGRAAVQAAERAAKARAADERAAERVAEAQRRGFGELASSGAQRAAVAVELHRRRLARTRRSAATDSELICRWRLQRRGQLPRAPFVYERQDDHKCAIHAVNNLFYAQVVTTAGFDAIWRLLPFLEATGELHRCLAPALREIEDVAGALRPRSGDESQDLGYHLTSVQMMLAVCGFTAEQLQRPADACGWAAACVPAEGGIPGCIVHTLCGGGHFMVFLPWGDGFRAVDSLRGAVRVDGGCWVTELSSGEELHAYVLAEEARYGRHAAVLRVTAGPDGWVAPDHPLSTAQAAAAKTSAAGQRAEQRARAGRERAEQRRAEQRRAEREGAERERADRERAELQERARFEEEAVVSGSDSGTDGLGSGDFDVDDLIDDDDDREGTPLAEQFRRRRELERSGNPSTRQRSRVDGWPSAAMTSPSSPGVSFKASLLSPIAPMGRLSSNVQPMQVSPPPVRSGAMSGSPGRLSPLGLSPLRLSPLGLSPLGLSPLEPLGRLQPGDGEPLRKFELPPLDDEGGSPAGLPAASQVRSQDLLADERRGAVCRRWGTFMLRRQALFMREPIPKDRRDDAEWIIGRLMFWEPHRGTPLEELHMGCRGWSKAKFLAELMAVGVTVSARVSAADLRVMWLGRGVGDPVVTDAHRLSQGAADLLNAQQTARRHAAHADDLRNLSPLARTMEASMRANAKERLRQMQRAKGNLGVDAADGDADADADGNLAGFVGAHPDDTGSDGGDDGAPELKRQAEYAAKIDEHRHRLLEGATARARRRKKEAGGEVPLGLQSDAIFAGDVEVEYWSALDGSGGSAGRVACRHCGALHMPCGRPVKKMTWACCLNGKLKELPRWEEPPAGDSASRYVWELWRKQDSAGRIFRKYSRNINSALALSHLTVGNQARHADGTEKTGYNPTVIVNGRVATLMGTLLPAAGQDAKFAQLYTLGGGEEEAALDRRVGIVMNAVPKTTSKPERQLIEVTLRSLVKELTTRLRRDNCYVRDFITAAESIREAEGRGESVDGVRVRVDAGRAPPGAPARTYIGDGRSEVYMIMPDEIGKGGFGAFELKPRPSANQNNPLRQLEGVTQNGYFATHRAADPTHFVLLFPDGRDGWHKSTTVPTAKGPRKVTAREWYNYYSYERERHPLSDDGVAWDDSMHRAGRLYQEWICAGWIKAEDNRLAFLASAAGQKRIRADNYADLTDHLNSDQSGVEVGRVINPATSRGSSRKLKKSYEDSMATVKHFGPPSLFITMTANGSAPEVTSLLKPGQVAEDRWDLCSEVFNAHRQQLLREIDAEGVFGPSVARFSVVEFQKRGLAHLHLLVWLFDQPTDGAAIDRIVKAMIPPAGSLRDKVLRTNVHTCGPACREGGRCTKFFPKAVSAVTRLKDPTERGDFVQYKRTAQMVTDSRGKIVTDGDMVPFNPWCTHRHGTHINVEIVASSKSPKYLTKYLAKGGAIDRAMVAEDKDADNEVAQYRSRRVVGSHSALLGLRKVPELELLPPTENLALHLPGKKMVFTVQEPGDDARSAAQVALDRAAERDSQLEAFFAANKMDASAFGVAISSLPYEMVPNYFTWHGASGVWVPRVKRGAASVGRLRWVHPKSGDVFYMRKLLLSKQGVGVCGFEELRTVDCVLHATFKAAAVALGMIEGSAEYSDCLAEAAATKMPFTLRRLFVSILAIGEVEDQRALLEAHWEDMTDDYKDHGVLLSEDTRQAMLRAELDHLASQAGVEMDIGDWGAGVGVDDVHVEAAAEALSGGDSVGTAAGRAAVAREDRAPSNEQEAFIQVVKFAAEEEGGCFFLSAGAGTGKTFTLDLLINELRAAGKEVAAMASSGIAAQLLPAPSGTIHSTLGVSIGVASMEVPRLDLDAAGQISRRRRVWGNDVFVIDEACMSHKAVFQALDNSLRSFARPESDGGFGPEIVPGSPHASWAPFGGKTVVLAGHWAQTLPIVPRGDRAATAHACAFNADFWGECQVWRLTENFRLRGAGGAAQHGAFLHGVAEGRTADAASGALGRLPDGGGVQALPSGMVGDDKREPLGGWVYAGAAAEVEAGGFGSEAYYEFWTSRAVLAPHRNTVKHYNEQVLGAVFGEADVLLSTDTIVDAGEDGQDPGTGWGVEMLNQAWPSGLPPHELPLMPGVPVMATQNLPHLGVFNGTRMIVLRVHHSRTTMAPAFVVCALWKGGRFTEVLIPRAKTVASDDMPFSWVRQQFPLQLCFAMTINKSQGQTLQNRVGVVLTSGVWSHGMLYVALGRVTDPANLRVLAPPNPGGVVINVVYADVLEVGEARMALD